ncbi:Putative disease resistance protein RGA4 [Morus notabilis]|uniref:Putative disease resistance protein RGA4 n=1 Tax=Morus notabilis TaxID=981085 RepID=W9RJC9_9ROSA|nr:Putative disease resistance protein RGA4 [Morus notabilis]
MADIILTPIVELIIGTLGSAAVDEIKSVYGAKDELCKLESPLSTIRSVLVDAEKRQIREEQVRDWLEKLEAVLDDADDLVDGVAAEGLRQKVMSGKKISKKVRTFFSSNNQLVFRHKMARRIKDIRERLSEIAAERRVLYLVERHEPATRVRDESHSFVVEKNVVGRDKDRKAIIELLLGPQNGTRQEKDVHVIPIVGMGGLGKTTLAQLVFNDERVQQHFELKVWVCVSNDFNVKVLCEKITKIVTNENIGNLEMEQLQRMLREKLNGKRLVLVLDDVWSEDARKWRELKELLTASCSKGSRIIVTTRLHTVANVMGTMQPQDLGILDSEDSWNLFKKMADDEGKELTNATLVDTAKGILAKCAGLPLAISMIGSTLLCSRNPETDWPSFLENDLSIITREEDGVLSTLKLSYDYLPSHLKPCFAYCRLFPKDHDFDVQTLVILWVAQGFIKPSRSQNLEEIGYQYFRDLLSRSFFQEAKKDELNMVTTCKMHDLVHDLSKKVAGEKYATIASIEDPRKVHHVSFDFESRWRLEVPSSLLQAQRLRSFLFPSDVIDVAWGLTTWDEIISNLKFLRVLHMHRAWIQIVPHSIGKLKHLRYLDLSYNSEIETLPASITKLVNLQTLKLNQCWSLRELPSEINKLVNLRHLELQNCWTITHMPRGLTQLTNLQTLSLVVLSEKIPDSMTLSKHSKLDELMGLNNLKGDLKIKGIRRGMETAVTKLRENKHLRSLYLDFTESNEDAPSSEQEWKTTLEGLQPHANLRDLTLDMYGGANLHSLLFPLKNLVALVLANCSKCQQLPSLDQFHSLKKMELHRLLALEDITINEGDSFFSTSSPVSVLPSLETLKLEVLPKFRGWWRSDMAAENQVEQVVFPSFPRLSHLSIYGCPKLTSMPCYPNVEGELTLSDTSGKHFEQTMLMRVPEPQKISTTTTTTTTTEVENVIYHPLSKLTSLTLENVGHLQYLPANQMKSLASLKALRIQNCPELKYLSPGIQNLTSLEYLRIDGCEELQLVANDDYSVNEWQGLTSLRSLEFANLPQLVTLPEGLQFLSTLKDLTIEGCQNFTGLPDWICNWCSLESLHIPQSPTFKSVPGSISSLTSLQELIINDKEMNPREIRGDLDLSSCSTSGT